MTNDPRNQHLLVTLMVAMALIVITLLVSIFIATRRPVVVILPAEPTTESLSANTKSSETGDATGTSGDEILPTQPAEVLVSAVPQAPAIDNPLDPFWQSVAVAEIPLLPQQVAEPILATPTVITIRVQAVRDNARYVWRLSWDQPQPTTASDFNQFSDAVALQFPLVDGAPYTMGGPNLPVTVLYWKALWQKDVDQGFQDTTVTRPAAYTDFYWFAPTTGPISADLLVDNPQAKQFMIAASSGNPMSDFKRKCPMEELTAHGFGSSTHVDSSTSQANGSWNEGQWCVVFERPIADSDPLINRFQQNPQQQLVAFAVWDGLAENRGGKKQISNWIPMRIRQ